MRVQGTRVLGEIGFISINDLTFTNWFYLEINLLETTQVCCFHSGFILRFIFQYSFIRLLWWHTAGVGLAAKTIYYPQSREDAQILSSSSWDFDSPRASIFAWSNNVCVISKLPTEYLSWEIGIRKFLLEDKEWLGLATVSVCLIVSDCFLWTDQICFLLGPEITLYSNMAEINWVWFTGRTSRGFCDDQAGRKLSWKCDASAFTWQEWWG